ncbi:hypothetical protein G4Y79_02115 [Phototrophicus methaneseepsis]|uniref:Alpha/beta hydrolase n=1 Tax=Phototrophicus methaneseepsis TaxID=2710758 RepID=A0A7S8EA31_9CHLR|nr:hypothetical protein [Phototrophicus methaneseepsis]QPC83193.1 hypothetical protein G4Y79_02115 [Phototrophicus methaneseepsis]
MTLTYDTLSITAEDGTILTHGYDHHMPRNHDALVVMLPGRGYLNSHPLLHFIRLISLQHQRDVLAVNYRFHQTNSDVNPEDLSKVYAESVEAIQKVAPDYKEVIIVAKSMGTPIAASLIGQLSGLRLLMLTPIGTAVADASGTPMLAIIGTADQAYAPEAVRNTDTTTWKVYDGLNHGLQYGGDWRASVNVLPDILQSCEDFILGK